VNRFPKLQAVAPKLIGIYTNSGVPRGGGSATACMAVTSLERVHAEFRRYLTAYVRENVRLQAESQAAHQREWKRRARDEKYNGNREGSGEDSYDETDGETPVKKPTKPIKHRFHKGV
jgi:hypothetical protein